jgi:hypothetical protein
MIQSHLSSHLVDVRTSTTVAVCITEQFQPLLEPPSGTKSTLGAAATTAIASVWLIRRYLFAKGKCLVIAVERSMVLRTHTHPFLHALADHSVFPNVPATFAASAC